MQKPSETVSKAAVQPGQEFIRPEDGGECGLKVPMPGPMPPPPPPVPKPGWQTSEFWVNIFVQIVSILAVTGVLTPGEASVWQSAAVMLGGLIASVISAIIYTKSRTTLKEPCI